MKELRILVADDDPVLRRVIAYTLQMAGMQVDAVADGILAQQALARQEYDLLVTDQQMPLCSGLELIESLRSSSKHANLPVILCTARGLELNKQELIARYQIAEILHKPFSPNNLKQRVLTLLASKASVCG